MGQSAPVDDRSGSQGKQPPGTLSRNITTSPVPLDLKDINIRVFLEGYSQSKAVSQAMTNPQAQHSHSPLPPQSTCSAVTSRSSSKARSHPIGEGVAHSSPSDRIASVGSRRTVSIVHEPPATPPTTSKSMQSTNTGLPRSSEINYDETRHDQPVGGLTSDAARLPKTSRSLRHRRSRSGLVVEFGSADTQQQLGQRSGRDDKLNRSGTDVRRSAKVQRPVSAIQPASLIIHPPSSPGLGSSPRKRSSQRPKSDLFLPTPPVDSTRFSTASTVANESPVHTTYTVPPTSYPPNNMTKGSTNSNKVISSSHARVDGIVPKEIDDYLKAHPEYHSSITKIHQRKRPGNEVEQDSDKLNDEETVRGVLWSDAE
jgi:hypothetical protein